MTTVVTSADTQNSIRFPATRYQGSKRRLANWILDRIGADHYETVLDAFGGTAAVSYAFKQRGKQVTYNDSLEFNRQIGLALIENDGIRLDPTIIESIGTRRQSTEYRDTIAQLFPGIYYTDEENAWLDIAVANVATIDCSYQRAIAWFALFQACMAKRPYNLFHRANLYMRSADVARSFGNKATWDRPFPEHFARYAQSANEAVFDGERRCRAARCDVLHVHEMFDLVYIDPPYISAKGVGVDYRDFYHFLEGMMHYDHWPEMIDDESKHHRLRPQRCPWSDPRTNAQMFNALFERFADSKLVVSYRSDGRPSIDELVVMLLRIKSDVRVEQTPKYQYALSPNRDTKEVLLIGT